MRQEKKRTAESISVIGMACIFPGAHTPEELWENVLAGRRYFRKSPEERLPRPDYFNTDPTAPGKSYSDQMALITGWEFDRAKFRMLPITVKSSDMSHWLALETTQSAIEDANLDLDSLDRERIGVILGNTLTGEFFRSHTLKLRWPYVQRSLTKALNDIMLGNTQQESVMAAMKHYFGAPLPDINEDSLAGNMSNTIAGRICNCFDLGAGGYTVDGACSSSLLAVAHACNALLNDEMDYAIVGGVDISLDPFEIVGFAKAQALSKDDIRPYDENAAGMLPGEGCGMFVLTRTEKALEAGHKIHAKICGWGISSDGGGEGITAPKVEGQMRALQKAYDKAGYPISSVALIEGHGTGTTLGDKVEITAIKRLVEKKPGQSQIWIGSIKGNIGHCKAAAGSAGLIKTVMALKRKILPPSMNCERPNPVFGRPMERLRPTIRGTTWPARKQPRRASVSSMGFGGANSHVTLEEFNPEESHLPRDLMMLGSHQKSEIIFISASSPLELVGQIDHLISIADRICRAELTDLSAALAGKKHSGLLRFALVVESPWQLIEALQGIRRNLIQGGLLEDLNDPESGIFAGSPKRKPTFMALFPGQASQRINMVERLLQRFPFVRSFLDEVELAIADIIPTRLKDSILFNPFSHDEETITLKEFMLQDTRIAQPAIVFSALATLRVLDFYGLTPSVSIGHSLGEICALRAAGVFDDVTAVKIAALRGRTMASLKLDDTGTMLAVGADPEKVQEMIQQSGLPIVISNYNSPKQIIVSGATPAIISFTAVCQEQGVHCQRLPVSHAFHSEIVAPAAESFRRTFEDFTFLPVNGSIISTSTAKKVAPDADIPELLAQQIRRPVRFTEAVLEGVKQQPDMIIEVGPKKVLTNFIKDILPGKAVCLPTDAGEMDCLSPLNGVLAQAFVLGFPLKMQNLFTHRLHRPFSLDDYQPKFIVNPCENQVDDFAETKVAPDVQFSPVLLPEGVGEEDFAAYLKSRGAFLKEFITMDYRHSRGRTPALNEQVALVQFPEKEQTAHETAETGNDDKSRDIIAFATDWISRRTGFPAEAITPQMRLRSDLNFDSIKVGELVINLARQMDRPAPSDPAVFADATLEDIIDWMSKIDPESKASSDKILPTAGVAAENITGRPDWVRTFVVQPSLAPLEQEAVVEIPANSSALILSSANCSRAKALKKILQQKSIALRQLSYNNYAKAEINLAQFSVIIALLPDPGDSWLNLSPAKFQKNLTTQASLLFNFYHWLTKNRDTGLQDLTCLVVQPTDSEGSMSELSAGAGFLKTLRLEYPDLQLKWIETPKTWSVEKLAQTLHNELNHHSERVWFSYTKDGRRKTDVAMLPAKKKKTPVKYDKTDILLVTGGAKGITFELAHALATRHGMKLALMGTSARPGKDADPARNEMAANFERLEAAGLVYHYSACDVTDHGLVRRSIRQAEKELHGSITAILHGAGFTKPTAFALMAVEDYLACIRVKAQGLFNVVNNCDPGKLKSVQVLSSVLGRTGMAGQADYAYANAWLDGAIATLARSLKHIHGFSLGYSVWAETGLGKRIGAAEALKAQGIVAINNTQGIEAYLKLAERGFRGDTFVCSGRLFANLEANLYRRPQPKKISGRFLQDIIQLVPETEVIVQATLNHETDYFLPEHVFQGTVLMPGVMAVEAMAQAASLCIKGKQPTMIHDVRFNKPLIVPEEAEVRIRIIGTAEPTADDGCRIHLSLRADVDNYSSDYFSMTCVFGKSGSATRPLYKVDRIPKALPAENLARLSPQPLFQGKLFRRIAAIRERKMGKKGITEIIVPQKPLYFSSGFSQKTVTPSPAIQDSFLQSAGLILDTMCLPASFKKILYLAPIKQGDRLFCVCRQTDRQSDRFTLSIEVFNESGQCVEYIEDAVFQTPQSGSTLGKSEPLPVRQSVDQLSDTLHFLPEKYPHIFVSEAFSENRTGRKKLPADLRPKISSANQYLANAATTGFAKRHLGLQVLDEGVSIKKREDGKPELRFADASLAQAFSGIDISIADTNPMSMAMVGPAPLGIDVEKVSERDAETWLSLLGKDGYSLALDLTNRTSEPFDFTATRVWTLLEAGKKANGLKRQVPIIDTVSDGDGHTFQTKSGGRLFRSHSILLDNIEEKEILALAVVTIDEEGKPDGEDRAIDNVDKVMGRFTQELLKLEIKCGQASDIGTVNRHHQEFEQLIYETLEAFQDKARNLDASKRRQHQIKISQRVLAYLQDRVESIPFQRALAKPLGYPGDYLLMDMMLQQKIATTGIGYHFDRLFIEYPGSEGVRQRTYWVVQKLEAILSRKKDRHLTILDMGCGPMTIEKILAEKYSETATFTFLGLDVDRDAMEYATDRLRGLSNVTVDIQHCNLLSQGGIDKIKEFAARADAYVCMGFFDYLDSTTITAFLETIHKNCSNNVPLFFANYHPDHPARPSMEWLLDWWLVYKNEAEMLEITEQAGFDPDHIYTEMDKTGSVVLVETKK